MLTSILQPKRGLLTTEVIVDILVYGLWMSVLCLLSFAVMVWGFGNGNLGTNCNEAYSPDCDLIFRARATTFVCLTWFALILAWEMVDMRHSFFYTQPNSRKPLREWGKRIWSNQFLFWAIIAGFFTIFPTIYIPVVNHTVFKHEAITWEWGVVFIEALTFILGVEFWKWCKRIYLRWKDRREQRDIEVDLRIFAQQPVPKSTSSGV